MLASDSIPLGVRYDKKNAHYYYEFKPYQLLMGLSLLLFSLAFPLTFWIFEIEVKGKGKTQRHSADDKEPYQFPYPILAFPLLFGSFSIFLMSSFPWSRLNINPMKNSCVWEEVCLPLFFPLFVTKSINFTIDRILDEVVIEDSGWRLGKSKSKRRYGKNKKIQQQKEDEDNNNSKKENTNTNTTNTDDAILTPQNANPRHRVVFDVRIRILKSDQDVRRLEQAKVKAIERLDRESEGFSDPAEIARVEEDFEKNKSFSVTVAHEENAEILERVKNEWNAFLKQLKMKTGAEWQNKKSE